MICRADLNYAKAVDRSEDGIPIGNGPLVAAIMGRADQVQKLVPMQFGASERGGVLANRTDLREGPQTTSAQRLGNASDALHTALGGDFPAGPAQPSVIRVFQAWPKPWEAKFQLLCRGGFLVSSEMTNGRIAYVQIKSQLGGPCRLRNPWPGGGVTLFRGGQKSETLGGPLLMFPTAKGESIAVNPVETNQTGNEKSK